MSDEQKNSSKKKKIIISVVAAAVAVIVLVLILALCLPHNNPEDPSKPNPNPGSDTPAHKHTLTAVSKQDATCTEKGNEAYWKCDGCGKMFSDSEGKNEIQSVPEIAAKGHSVPSMTETKPADCTNKGQKSGKCEVCQQTVTEDIPALGHQTGDWQLDESFHWKECSRCGRAVERGNHVFVNGKCSFCNFDQNAEIAAELTFELLDDGSWSVTGMTNSGVATYVDIPATHEGTDVTVIGEKAFYSSRIKRIIFRNENVVLDKACFSHCHSLIEVRFDEGVRKISTVEHWYWDYPDYPFYNSEKIVSVYLGSAVNSLETKLFGGYSLTSTYGSDPVLAEIHPTFSFERYEVSPDNAKYGTDEYGILYNKQTKVLIFVPYKLTGDVTVLSDTEEIRDGAFGCVSGVTAIKLPNGLKKIGECAFNSTGISELTIPDSVTELGRHNGIVAPCYNCRSLRKLSLGAGLQSRYVSGIGRYLPDSVTSITVSPSNPYIKSDGNCIVSADGRFLYLSDSSGRIPVGVTGLEDYAFTPFGKTLTSVTIPSAVNLIYAYAFDGCTALTSVYFDDKSNWNIVKSDSSTDYHPVDVPVDVSSSSNNATLLTETYRSYDWRKR